MEFIVRNTNSDYKLHFTLKFIGNGLLILWGSIIITTNIEFDMIYKCFDEVIK